ncbi:MobC [Salmonella enterica subsp. enterica serovar Give]|nr:MobC [Salmonella enterica subsp. enterica serovar Give]ECA4141824.1 MobC [Salmonella enterica subsp. enterica serovar Give]
MPAKKKAFYSSEDIGKFKSILDDLPDVTSERLEKKHVLDELKSDIRKLKDSKGYEDKEILKFLNDAGFTDVTLRDIKDITAGRVGKKRTSSNRKAINVVDESQRTHDGSTGQNPDASTSQY